MKRDGTLRIISLEVENFKKLKVAHIQPKGNVVKITGANGSGKSTALDAIALALVGARGGPSVPVRRGAERGMVKVDLGEFVVTRQWYEAGNPKGEMWIEAKDGRRYGTPQAVLDAVMGKISFDPLAFTGMESKQQADQLRMLLDIDEPLTKLKEAYDTDYQTRKETNRELDDLKAQRKAYQYPEGLPEKKRDLDAMIAELGQASTRASEIAMLERERKDFRLNLENLDRDTIEQYQKVAELRAEADRLEAEAVAWEKQAAKNRKEMAAWKPLPEPPDAAALAEAITIARGVNLSIERREKAAHMDEEIITKGEAVAKLNRALDANRQAAADLISKAQYPIPGLGFSEGEVTFNDLPFAQASDAEKIKIAISIAMIGNPKLRVMRIKDGSLLDAESMKVVEQMAEEHDYQVWIEVVDQTGKLGVYLVDGEVAAVDGEPVKQQPKPTLAAARKPREKAVKE